jgi:predicted homoserine dehydrogenase-like protein
MNLHQRLLERAAEGDAVRVGLVGAGKFAAMFLAQVPRTPGLHVVAIADLAPERARATLARVGWSPERSGATRRAARPPGSGTCSPAARRASTS